jgi:hypothetical protein
MWNLRFVGFFLALGDNPDNNRISTGGNFLTLLCKDGYIGTN